MDPTAERDLARNWRNNQSMPGGCTDGDYPVADPKPVRRRLAQVDAAWARERRASLHDESVIGEHLAALGRCCREERALTRLALSEQCPGPALRDQGPRVE